MGDNIWLDDRNGVRTPMQWNDQARTRASPAADRLYAPVIDDDRFGYQRLNVEAQQADRDSLLNWLKHAMRVRREHPAFGRGSFEWVKVDTQAVAAYWRTLDDDRVLVLHNLSDQVQPIELADPALGWFDLLTQSRLTQHVSLQPYQFLWLVARLSVPDAISHGEIDA